MADFCHRLWAEFEGPTTQSYHPRVQCQYGVQHWTRVCTITVLGGLHHYLSAVHAHFSQKVEQHRISKFSNAEKMLNRKICLDYFIFFLSYLIIAVRSTHRSLILKHKRSVFWVFLFCFFCWQFHFLSPWTNILNSIFMSERVNGKQCRQPKQNVYVFCRTFCEGHFFHWRGENWRWAGLVSWDYVPVSTAADEQ